MLYETVGRKDLEGYQVRLYKRSRVDGHHRYFAEAKREQGERVLLDHWNLSKLLEMLDETLPVINLARSVK